MAPSRLVARLIDSPPTRQLCLVTLDSHQHFWQYDLRQYGWMTSQMSALRRDFLPADLAPLLKIAETDGTIAVQARQSLAETAWLLKLADQHSFIRGVVGWVDLCAHDVCEQLGSFAAYPKFRGVRHVAHDEPDERFMRRAEFRRGIAALAEFGLTYDLLVFPRHLAVAQELVAEFPRQLFVVDHVAKPAVKTALIWPWADDLRALAAAPNVYCKLSGLTTESEWGTWRAADVHRYFDVACEAFGPARLMFGSDWPVCTLSTAYDTAVALVRDWAAQFPLELREGIMGENAAAFYGVDRIVPARAASLVT
jgi:L-fuconolactonase